MNRVPLPGNGGDPQRARALQHFDLGYLALLEDRRYINPARFPLTVSNSAAGYASIWEDIRALNVTVSDGNCGALDAVACADAVRRDGRAGGGDPARCAGNFCLPDQGGRLCRSASSQDRRDGWRQGADSLGTEARRHRCGRRR